MSWQAGVAPPTNFSPKRPKKALPPIVQTKAPGGTAPERPFQRDHSRAHWHQHGYLKGSAEHSRRTGGTTAQKSDQLVQDGVGNCARKERVKMRCRAAKITQKCPRRKWGHTAKGTKSEKREREEGEEEGAERSNVPEKRGCVPTLSPVKWGHQKSSKIKG